MATRKPPRTVVASITDYTKDGFGLGDALGADGYSTTVEVPFTKPGDQVEAILVKKGKVATKRV